MAGTLRNAVREGDPLLHGGTIQAGAATVLVNGQRAARLNARFECPQTTPIPHGTGALHLGMAALTVLIEGVPGAAKATIGACKVPIGNWIDKPSDNVKYGITDTINGMKVTQDPDGTIHVGKHIVIKPGDSRSPDFPARVLGALAVIASTAIGRATLNTLDNGNKQVNIVQGHPAHTEGSPPQPAGVTQIMVDPSRFPPTPGADRTATGAGGDVVLFHELSHAKDIQTNNVDHTPLSAADQKIWDNAEERQVITGDEAEFRRERGLPQRTSHHEI